MKSAKRWKIAAVAVAATVLIAILGGLWGPQFCGLCDKIFRPSPPLRLGTEAGESQITCAGSGSRSKVNERSSQSYPLSGLALQCVFIPHSVGGRPQGLHLFPRI